jgi:CubicO group peptidase (beta-lactamase class C family)
MFKQFISVFLVFLLTISASKSQLNTITGYWEVRFADSARYTKQILHFRAENGSLQLTIDEPLDGTLKMPGEKPFFENDSLHYESLWGLFKYNGTIAPGDSIIQGARLVNNSDPSPFIMKRVSEKELLYKIPRINAKGERIYGYIYLKPSQTKDGLDCASLSETEIDSGYIIKLVQDILKSKIATIHSLLLAKDNKLILEEYFHNYNRNILHSQESVTKSFTSALMGIAIDKKFIPGVNELVWPYFLKWDSTKWIKEKYNITIKHLLTMTAGLDWKAFTLNESNDDVNIYPSPDYIAYILNKNLKTIPGEKFFYNNRIMYLQGKLIENSSGLSVDSFATRYLFSKLGVKNHKWKAYDNGITETGGGLKLLPRDMMKFGLLYLNHGKWKNEQIISSEWIDSSLQFQSFAGDADYGYNWWMKTYTVDSTDFNVYYALGHGEQTIMLIPDVNVVFVMTAGNYFQMPQKLDEIMVSYILPSLNSCKKIQNKTIITLNKLTGAYEIKKGESINIKIDGNILTATDPSGAILKLIQKTSNRFIVEKSNREVRFIIDKTGTITAAELFVNGTRIERLKKIK